MPRVQMPDGTVVDMPDTLTPELATRLKALQSGAAPAPKGPTAPELSKQYQQQSGASVVGDIARGAASNAVDIGRGALAGTISMPGEMSKGVQGVANWANAKLGGDPHYWSGKTALPEFESTLARVPRLGTEPTAQTKGFETMGGVVAPMPGAGMVKGAMAVPKLAGRAAEAVGGALKVSPEIAELAQKAQAAGIPLRPDMLTNSRIAKMVGDTLEKVPLSGDMAGKRQIAFNQAVIDTIGGDTKATKLTPDVYRKAMSTTGQAIGDLAAKYDVPMAGGLKDGLAAIEKGADFETDSTARILKKYVDEIRSHADASGKIDGTTFRKIRTQLTGQMRRTNDGDLKYALSNLDEVMLDSVKSQMTPEELATFGDLRRKYANGKSLEPLVAKGEGDISASKLMARMTATGSGKSAMAKGTGGDLGDIARIGQKFLGEPPTPRNTAYGVLGEIGAGAVAPGTTTTLVGASNLYNRAAPRIAKGMIERSKVKPPVQP